MAVQPRGSLSCPLGGLKTLLENCAVWQFWANGYEDYAYDYGYALNNQSLDYYTVLGIPASNHIYTVEFDATEEQRPAITLVQGDEHQTNQIANGGSNLYWQQFHVVMIIEDNVSNSEDIVNESDKEIYFTNLVGDLLKNIQQISGQDGFVNVVHMGKRYGPSKSSRFQGETGREYFEIAYDVVFEGI